MGLTRCTLLGLVALAQASAALAGQLALQTPRFTILASNASTLRQEPISLSKQPTPLHLGPSDTLKLSFQVVAKDGEESKGVQPHQTFLRFYDKQTGEEGVQPVRVSPTGKAKFELNMARPPASLPPTPSADSPLEVQLLIGSFKHSPATVDLFKLYLPVSHPAPVHAEEHTFHPRPEIQHTFRPEQRVPNKLVSGLAAILVGAGPWILLAGLLLQIRPFPSLPRISEPTTLSFIVSLTAFEGLLFWYWVDLKLGQVLAYGAVLGLLTTISGKKALEARTKSAH